jgi:hypothetical protein
MLVVLVHELECDRHVREGREDLHADAYVLLDVGEFFWRQGARLGAGHGVSGDVDSTETQRGTIE